MKRMQKLFDLCRCRKFVMVGFVVMALTQTGHPSILADFSSADQYPGTGGSGGWLTPWTIKTGGSGVNSTNAAIMNTDPLTSGGANYLSFTASTTSTSGTAYLGLYRQIDSSVVNLSQPLVYNFDYRVDYDAVSNYQYNIFSTTSGNNAVSSNDTWYIKSTINSGWQIAGSTYSTGVSVITGHTYHFTITVNPALQTYTVSISDLDNNTSYTSATSFAFRNSITSDGSYLCFTITDDQKSSTDLYGFSVDNITIASIPELSTVVYLILLGAFLGIPFYRRLSTCSLAQL